LKFSRKTMTASITLILTLTITATLLTLPVAVAHDPPWTIPTNAYVTLSPSRVGLGQYAVIVVFVDRYSPTAGGGSGQRWNGFQIDITKPDGTKETIGPWQCRSDVGSDYQVYTPSQVGTYSIVFSWPGETVYEWPGHPDPNDPNLGDFYAGSTSEPAYLVVLQEEPIEPYQEPPLPTEYWERPINAANRGWSQLASSWLAGSWLVGNWQRWGKAPESPHVLWTQPYTPGFAGGINDAQWGGIPSNVRDYESAWESPIIMNGKIYYNTPPVADSCLYGYYCRDLYTGEIIWYKNGTDNGLGNPSTIDSGYTLGQVILGVNARSGSDGGIDCGWLYHYHSVNGQGILEYLVAQVGSTWYFFDAATGNWVLTLINVPGGTAATDEDGSLLLYSYNPSTGNVLCWNVSQAIPPREPLGTSQQQWKMRFGTVVDAVNDTAWTEIGPTTNVPAEAIQPRSGYTMNVTVQAGLPCSVSYGAVASGFSRVLTDENRVPKQLFGFYKGRGSSIGSPTDPDTFSAWLISIDYHVTDYSPHPEYSATQNNNLGFGATLLWNKNITVPLPGKNYTWNLGGVSYDDQVFCITCKQTMQLWGYSLETGELLWGPTTRPFSDISFYGVSSNMYYGKVLSVSYAGTIYAYDAQTGVLLWNYNDTAPAYESPYGDNFPLSIAAVADGKVYLYSSEHSPTKPLWRPYLICLDITDGTELWKLLFYNDGLSVADGYIVAGSEFDNLIYCIGKGPSETTVSASPTIIADGDSVLIKGTVMDQSPGTKQTVQASRFPKGVPAIADDDMQAWMEYVYMQQAMPLFAKGVEVVLETLDPNGNYYEIGRVTSDASGMFKLMWEPTVLGEYTIVASFTGSESYWGSTAETAIGVTEAPSPAQPIEPEEPTEAPFITTEIAIIIAVVVVAIIGIVAFWALRKRK